MAKRRKPTDSSFDFDTPIGDTGGNGGGNGAGDGAVPLHEAAQSRYLNYALSVITSRALPDVRDGLKPVQRRILYTMWQQGLTADAKHRKCAKVVGDVMGSFHPHGDAAIYETLVRMAQPFSLRYPLVDGSGNFGSLDGDPAAAMRYTECRLSRISDELLTEIEQDTVQYRPNYDGTKTEPVVLPARLPNLLINGATGIAVGMATNIPPHNLGEVCTALIKLLDNDELGNAQLCRYIKGPDFPTGGQILNSLEEIKAIYKTGSGCIRLRGTWDIGDGDAIDEDDLHRQHSVHRRQVAARRADRRGHRATEAAAAARCEGRVDRGRPHRARDEERRRREDGDGVSLQAHGAADDVSREPHVSHSDREPRGRAAGAARSEVDPLAFPAFPARGRHRPPRARAAGAEEAHPHPRRLRESLRRARRGAAHRPEVRREGGRGREDHEAVRPRRRADRRDSRAEDLSSRAAGDSRHPAGARREAEAGAPDRRPAQERREPMDARARGARSRFRRRTRMRRRTSGGRSSRPRRPSNTQPTISSSKKTTSSSCRRTAGSSGRRK